MMIITIIIFIITIITIIIIINFKNMYCAWWVEPEHLNSCLSLYKSKPFHSLRKHAYSYI